MWVLAECGWLVARHDGLSWRLFVMSVAVAAPAIVSFAVASGLVWGAWHDGAAVRWLRDNSILARMRRPSPGASAWLVTVSCATGFAGLVTLRLGVRIWATVARPHFAIALLACVEVAVVAVAVLFAPVLHRPLARRLRRVAAGRAAWLAAPATIAAVVLATALAALLAGFVLWGDTLRALPWGHVVAPLLAIFVAVVFETRARARLHPTSVTAAGVWLCLVGVTATGLFAADDRWRQELVAYPTAAGASLPLSTWLFDFDGDGELGWLGGHDCAPFDADRHPQRLEIANNGIDEDCSGRDLTFDENAVRLGEARHGHPDAMVERPHIILVTTDALSFRHTGLGGYARPVTPHLDAFAERATVFTSAFSAGPETASALPALFTGRHPSEVAGLNAYAAGPDDVTMPVLAEALSARGYDTHAILGGRFLSPTRWPRLTRGFATVDDSAIASAEKRYSEPKAHTSPEMTDLAVALVRREQQQPLFLWIHYFDHHPFHSVPRGEPAFGAGEQPVDAYDSELRFTDRHWGELFAAIEQRFAPNEYVLVFTADHGEAFDANHDDQRHAHCLKTEEVHVPLLVQTPRRRGERVADLASHLDVVPTLLDLSGSTATPTLRGESLVAALFDGRPLEKTVLFSSFFDPRRASWGGDTFRQVGIRMRDLVFLDDRERRTTGLYRWTDDPLERDDVSHAHPEQAELGNFLAKRHVRDRCESLALHCPP